MSLLFQKSMGGRGVICSRQKGGWSLPAYYTFGSTDFSSKLASFKSFDMIFLFMNDDAVKWFEKGALQLKGKAAGVAGPVGKISPEALTQNLRANIIIYALVDGKLGGMDVEGDFLNPAVINPDNNINKAVYGLKGREVLEGKEPKVSPAAPGVTVFRDALNEHFPPQADPPPPGPSHAG
jgi:lipid-binding SYLF domain-containing protein